VNTVKYIVDDEFLDHVQAFIRRVKWLYEGADNRPNYGISIIGLPLLKNVVEHGDRLNFEIESGFDPFDSDSFLSSQTQKRG
jgi:hypothetical protein